jgi:hypothetical protein
MIKILYDKISNGNNDDLLWKADNNEAYNKFSQHVEYKEPIKEPEIKPEKKPVIKEKKSQKKTLLKPLEIILNESNTFGDFQDNVKDKLIKFITQKEFNKVFGITKSSEIMSGIVNNRWNKSTALFISFLFNKSIEYNDAIISYKKDEYKEVIYLST